MEHKGASIYDVRTEGVKQEGNVNGPLNFRAIGL